MKNYRRFFIKTLFNLGILSLIPFKMNALEYIQDCETTSDIEGPFYTPNSPNISILTPPEITSDFLFITGTVYANDCITPIPNAVVDIWHANKGELLSDGEEDFFGNSTYVDNFYRAKIYTDINGNYAYQTILPGKYLNGGYYRPSHIHYKSSYLNQNELTTQLYFENDTTIAIDPWASNVSAKNRIIPLTIDKNNNLNGVFDITLNTDPKDIESTSIEENKLIKSIFPNPINETSCIYLTQNNSKISLKICDVNGKIITSITTLKEKIQLYDLLNKDIKRGIYILKAQSKNQYFDAKRFVVK